jgi:hypothetical protein
VYAVSAGILDVSYIFLVHVENYFNLLRIVSFLYVKFYN